MIFERRAWFIVDAAILLLLLVSLRLVYWQMIRGSELLPAGLLNNAAEENRLKFRSDDDLGMKALLEGQGSLDNPEELPQPVIQRLTDLLSTITRGSIYDRNGNILAEDRLDTQGNRIRFYTQPGLAHTLGYVSGLRIGISGLERSYNQILLGLDQPEASFYRMLHQPISGNNLVLTIDGPLQRAAEDALEGKTGSIIVMDAHSGAILAMASLPGYDPNRILEPGYLASQVDACAGAPHCSGILLNRATQALYPPGSTWKTVTLIAALDSGQVPPDMVFDFGEPVQSPNGPYYVYRVGGGVISDPNHRENRLNLELSYAKSANAAFARIGDEMPAQVLMDYAARFGFASPGAAAQPAPFPLEMDLSQGQLVSDAKDIVQNDLLRAATAIGQGELLTTPLNMGMVVLAVLNDGNLPLPYLVEKVYTPSGIAAAHQPERALITGLMKPDTAQIVRRMMATVVTQGSGGKAAVEGLTIGGKTGTAQVGGDLAPHAWFTGFAQNADQAVVIVVLIENGGEGSQVAAPIFARMAQAVFAPENRPEPAVTLAPPTPTPQPAAQTAVPTSLPESPALTPTLTPVFEGIPPPDIPYRGDRTDFTELGSATCPGNQSGPIGDGKFIWPSVYQAVSGEKFAEGHPGVDFSTPPGVPVYAADDGLVIFAGWSALGYGNVIVVDHGNGYKTLYAHLSQISQYCGAKVKSGQLIGMSGSTGNSSGPHLHFEVRVPGGYLNPLKVLPTP
jgi:peptidoglycan glycosyltransferase